MEQFSTVQCVLILKTFYENGECATQTVKNSEPFLAEMKLRLSALYTK